MKDVRKFVLITMFSLSFMVLLVSCQGNSNTIVDPNNPPANAVTVSIASPASGQTVTQDQPISFNGSAVLGSSGQINLENLVWSSDKDGVIGTGLGFTRSGLSIGNHTITLTATAESGEIGTAETQLTNQANSNGMTVLIESPAGSRIMPYDLINLSGSALAPDGTSIVDPLAFEWHSDIETNPGPILGDGLEIESSGLTPGLHTITLTVNTPDGSGGTVTSAAAIDLFVEFDNSGITVDILAPFNGVHLIQGESLTCTGSASQNGGGSFDSIIWTSSMDGWVGANETCIIPSLSLGTHRITMTATASDGKKGTVATIVEVIE